MAVRTGATGAAERRAFTDHIAEVRATLLPRLRVARFPDAGRLIARFESIVTHWHWGRPRHPDGVVECVNEICVALRLLDLPGGATLAYEPRTASGQSIDFLLTSADARRYTDVKAIHPRGPKKGGAKVSADHFTALVRARFLEHATGLERKIADLPDGQSAAHRLVFCGDGVLWQRDLLAEFAHAYRGPIQGFGMMQRAPAAHQPDMFLCDVTGPAPVL